MGVDFWGYMFLPHCVIKALGQAKHTRSVGRPTIDQLAGRVQAESKRSSREAEELGTTNPLILLGLVVTTGEFTSGAKEAAEQMDIKLVGGVALARELVDLGVGIKTLTEDFVEIEATPPLEWLAAPSAH